MTSTGVGRGRYPGNRLPKGTKVYPPETVAAVQELYLRRGMTRQEVAMEMGITPHVVERVMKNHDIPSRPPRRRNQAGPANPMWKGDSAGYQAMHLRVEALRGKPMTCEVCQTTEARSYDWANLTGNYENPMDFSRMCRSCHRKYDNQRRRDARP